MIAQSLLTSRDAIAKVAILIGVVELSSIRLTMKAVVEEGKLTLRAFDPHHKGGFLSPFYSIAMLLEEPALTHRPAFKRGAPVHLRPPPWRVSSRLCHAPSYRFATAATILPLRLLLWLASSCAPT